MQKYAYIFLYSLLKNYFFNIFLVFEQTQVVSIDLNSGSTILSSPASEPSTRISSFKNKVVSESVENSIQF